MRIGGWAFGINIHSPGYRGGYACYGYRRLWFVAPAFVVTRRCITVYFGGVHYTTRQRDDAREWKEIREAKPRVYVNPERVTPWDHWNRNGTLLDLDLDLDLVAGKNGS